MSEPLPEWMTVEQVAELLQVKPDTLDKWRQRSVGPRAHRLGLRLVRYRSSDVVRWLETRPTSGEPEPASEPETEGE